VWCDASEFLSEAKQEHYARALELYRGDLLNGFFADAPGFERWLEEERVHFRDVAGMCAWSLAERYATSADLTSATRWARRAVNLAPTDERRLRKALSLLHQAGDRAGAVKLFDDFARRLRAELDVDPSQETQALMREIRGR
jgi:serine/threonine-protein kinase